ncbi:MAG TPA: purine-nucleoside phosphorylase [Planctomycetota bacterium]|nr:purine-nucleoside phosphorylase [Planctomycetota bacterium]
MSGPTEAESVERAATFLRQRLGATRLAAVRLGLVLGSGLADFGKQMADAVVVPFAEIPGWPVPHVQGHGATLACGTVAQTPVMCLTGRVHLYEGWRPADVVRAVRTLRHLGVPNFLLTNAAGGIADDLSAGDLMVITDHLNLTGCSPLVGPHHAAFGPRFPDQSSVYSARLRALLQQAGARLRTGVYAGLLGPSYETPAEVRMLKTLGADAVGMSTVHEAIALNAMGAQVAGLSLISNLAAGISARPLSHDEVVAAGASAGAALTRLVAEFCRRLTG